MPKSKTEKSLNSVIDAAMKAAETQGWATVTLYDVAKLASIPLDELYEAVGSKQQILNAFARRVDKAMLSDFERDSADSVRDRLFEMILARFDEMLPLSRRPEIYCKCFHDGRWLLQSVGARD